MAQDATGNPTSPDNIPTFNTAVDNPSGKGSNAQMAAIQTALSARVTPPAGVVAGEGMVWNGSAWVRSSVTKLASGNFGPVVNADIDPAAAIAISKLASYPSNGGVFLAGDGTWKAAGGTTYRKTTAKAVNTTIAATDLLNNEITIGAGVLGTTGILRATLLGDFLNNSGAIQTNPRFQLVVGGTTIFDTSAAGNWSAGTIRATWRIIIEAVQQGAANAQDWSIDGTIWGGNLPNTAPSSAFTTGTGWIGGITGAGVSQGVSFKGNNTGAIDFSASKTFVFNVINGVSNALYETRLQGALVEIV